jgi:hypothetical protein
MSSAARRLGACCFAGLCAAGLVFVAAGAAQAAPGDPIPAEVRFEIGPYNATARDWPIAAVQVSGGLLEGKRVAVTLEGAGGATLWEGEADFAAPVTRLVVGQFVPVAAVVRVSLAQQGFPVVVAGIVTKAAVAGVPPAVEGKTVEVRPEVITRPLPSTASSSVREVVARGTASAPRMAVSMIVLLVVFAIVFRLPLMPVGAQSRWRR